MYLTKQQHMGEGGQYQYLSMGIPVGLGPSAAPMYVQSQFSVPQPPALGQPSRPWTTGLCGCFDDFANCCITCWCPCITFGQIAKILDRGSSSCAMSAALYFLLQCWGCACFYSCFYRTKLRSQYALHEHPCPDCLVHCCCETCALCQEYRELKNRGYDVPLGWQGNIEKQAGGVTTPPTTEGGMSR